MSKYLRLSHILNAETPVSDTIVEPIQITPILRIANGNNSNLSRLSITNHYGTHVDSPNHFNPVGKKLVDFPIESFIFTSPLLLDIPMGDDGLLSAGDLIPHADRISRCDLLLLRSGFSQYRSQDPQRYRFKTPGVSAEAAQYLMQFPGFRAIGVDFISLEWTVNTSHGFRAHQVLLGDNDHPVMIIEDMLLDGDLANLYRVYMVPLLFADLDSFQCTVIAELND